MGVIYLARHRTNGRLVVLKVMHAQLATQKKYRDLFQRELDCMKRLKHPYAIGLVDASLTDPGGPCLVMEYVRGSDFDRLLRHYRRFSPTRIGRLFGQLCEVLHAAHGQGIIHRDLKPANLMVADWSKPLERIKVMDFGLAQLPDDAPSPARNGSGNAVTQGTPEFMSPEQVRGHQLDARADLYSVGVILYELLTGRLPFVRPSPKEIMRAHLTDAPPPLALAGLPPALEAIVMACLAKDPAARPQNAWELGQRLETALGQRILDRGATDSLSSAPPPVKSASPPQRPTQLSIQRPLRTTMLGIQLKPRLTLQTMQGVAKPSLDDTGDDDEVVFRLEVPLAERAVLEKLGAFFDQRGGKVLERGANLVRALLGEAMRSASGAPVRPSFHGTSTLTELEVQLSEARDGTPSASDLKLTMRPVGAASVSASVAWRAGCERLRNEVCAHLGR